jgi:hypothetical protein
MKPRRYLCSELVVLKMNSADSTVNLEEIWRDGAAFESETPVLEGVEVELRCGPALFAGKVVRAEQYEFGWRVEVEFSPSTPWSPEQFRPRHMLDASTLGASESQAG